MRNWPMIFFLVAFVMQVIVRWTHAKKTGEKVRDAVLPDLLLIAATAVILVREGMGNISDQTEWGLLFLVAILLLLAFLSLSAQVKRHLQAVGLLE
jgi:hypothetical protein